MPSRYALCTILVLCASLAFVYPNAVSAPQKNTDCSKPPKLIPPPKPSPEEKKKAKKLVQGEVAVEIDENGDVVSAKPVRPPSGEEADKLVARVRAMKYEPRPGCGIYKAVMNFIVGE